MRTLAAGAGVSALAVLGFVWADGGDTRSEDELSANPRAWITTFGDDGDRRAAARVVRWTPRDVEMPEENVQIFEPTPETIHPRHAAMVAHFERIFRGQERSEQWAESKEGEIREFFATQSEAEGSRLLSADCRGSMCRVRIAHNDPNALSRFMDAAGMRAPFAVAGARFPDPDANHSVMFLAREETLLPWPDSATLDAEVAP